MNQTAFAAHGEFAITESQYLSLEATYATNKYNPTPKEDFPYQESLSWTEMSLQGVLRTPDKTWAYGLYARSGPQFVRESYASISAKTNASFGPVVQSVMPLGRWEYVGDYAIIIGSEYGAHLNQHFSAPLWQRAPLAGGIGAAAEYLLHSGGTTLSMTAYFSIGFEF